ncbi:MAG: exo-alpha-sialidase [Planctomycetia bacterium]|nr:exo-alpha-sialidase [Planctomycetia bacterium]
MADSGLEAAEGQRAAFEKPASPPAAVEAIDVEQREVYRSAKKPAYTSWVSLFPGQAGEWYLSCEEVLKSDPPATRSSLDHWYRMGLPDGYDKSPLRMEVVLLESRDQCGSWNVISRWPCRFQHSAGSFAAAKTRDGRFLRGVWGCYRLDDEGHSGELLYESRDEGKTWQKLPALMDARFAAYPHRMKQLRDGTIVVAVPFQAGWGRDADLPLRTSMRLEAQNEMQMGIFISSDEGRTWLGPTIIFPGHVVSETDFVELPSGDLLFFNNSIFAQPGRQMVCRTRQGLVPGPMLKCHGQSVPETVVLTRERILVGAMRNGNYTWSDDEGATWHKLNGAPACGYQPMIRQMDDGRVLCAWHRGADDAFAGAEQFVGVHLFRLKVNRPTAKTRLNIDRGYDAAQDRFLNEYLLTLTADGRPLPEKNIELWYVARDAPGYDSWCHKPISERMKAGGKLISATTDARGQARFALAEFDARTIVHDSYQLFARFNADRSDPDFAPATTPQCEFYAVSHGNR